MSANIHQKLADIQSELFVPKGKRNEFGNFNYRSCEDILKSVKPLLEKNKCTLTMSNRIVSQGSGDNAVQYVETTVTLFDLESDAKIEVAGQAREPYQKKGMDDMQITGAASSYARKYALAGMFAIDNEKDSDADDNRGYDPKKPKEVKATNRCMEAWNKYQDVAKKSGESDTNKIRTNFAALVKELTGKTRSSDVTPSEWDKVMSTLDSVIEPAKGEEAK